MRLIDRQRALIDHLVAPAEFRGREDGAGLSADLLALDPACLRIVGEQALAKRMSKVRAVFPHTCTALGANLASLATAFADACPPDSIERWDNARQFRDFLVGSWTRVAPDPAYLTDLLAFEEALWLGRRRLNQRLVTTSHSGAGTAQLLIRADGIVSLALDYDIRGLAARGSDQPVVKRPTYLVVRQARIGVPVKVFEIPLAAFDLLGRLDQASGPGEQIDAILLGDLLKIGAIVPVS